MFANCSCKTNKNSLDKDMICINSTKFNAQFAKLSELRTMNEIADSQKYSNDTFYEKNLFYDFKTKYQQIILQALISFNKKIIQRKKTI